MVQVGAQTPEWDLRRDVPALLGQLSRAEAWRQRAAIPSCIFSHLSATPPPPQLHSLPVHLTAAPLLQ